MLLWDQLYCCFCNIEPNEKQLFLQGNALVGGINYVFVLAASNLMKNNGFCTNAVVGSITSLLLQHQT